MRRWSKQAAKGHPGISRGCGGPHAVANTSFWSSGSLASLPFRLADTSGAPRSAEVAIEESTDEGLHLVELVLKGEVPSVEEVQLRMRQVTEISARAVRRENFVVRAPDNQCRWFPLP